MRAPRCFFLTTQGLRGRLSSPDEEELEGEMATLKSGISVALEISKTRQMFSLPLSAVISVRNSGVSNIMP